MHCISWALARLKKLDGDMEIAGLNISPELDRLALAWLQRLVDGRLELILQHDDAFLITLCLLVQDLSRQLHEGMVSDTHCIQESIDRSARNPALVVNVDKGTKDYSHETIGARRPCHLALKKICCCTGKYTGRGPNRPHSDDATLHMRLKLETHAELCKTHLHHGFLVGPGEPTSRYVVLFL